MTVKELIKKLKVMPQDLQVYWADHDHGEFETGGKAREVFLIDKPELTDEEIDSQKVDIYECYNNTPQKYVLIRP